jgi:hypothetical protein
MRHEAADRDPGGGGAGGEPLPERQRHLREPALMRARRLRVVLLVADRAAVEQA